MADTKFSHDRGFYDVPFNVNITCTTGGANIRYTLDGSKPTITHGSDFDSNSPIPVNTTSFLRAATFKPGWLQSDVDTQTYIFLKDVMHQTRPPGADQTDSHTVV